MPWGELMKKYTQRKDGRYQAKVHIGKGQYTYLYDTSVKRLDKKVAELKIKLGKGVDVHAERDTLKEWVDRWLATKKYEVTESRLTAYKCSVKRLEPLYDVPISKIRLADLQDIALEMYENEYAESTIKDYKNAANQIFKMAIDNRVLEFNPAANIKVYSGAPKESRRALTRQEQEWISAPSDNRGHVAAMIMMYAGLRRGELIPLQWTDIDFDNRTISITKSVKMVSGKSVLKSGGKSKSAVRIVYIPQILADFLQNVDRKNSLIVCPSAKGKMLSETAYKRMWDSYKAELNRRFGNFSGVVVADKKGKLKQYELPDSKFDPTKIPQVIPNITAHMLRHTFITNMYLAGVDVMTAKEQAGHSDIQTTLNIYTHLDGIYKKKEISKLDQFYATK